MPEDPPPGTTTTPKPAPAKSSPAPLIHRVCVQCNNVFLVPADKFDAKLCPNCHKG